MADGNYSITNVTADHFIEATFTLTVVEPPMYAYPIANGNATLSCDGPISHSSSESCSTTNNTYACQISLGISAAPSTMCRLVPASGSTFSSGSGCSGTLVAGVYTMGSLPTACTVSGRLSGTLAQFAIAGIVSGDNGTISCTSPVYAGTASTCTITPAAGYVLSSVTDNGVNVSSSVSGGSYTMGGGLFSSGVSSNHQVIANFVQGAPGDYDSNGIVSIAEVQSAIHMFLGLKTPEACVDRDSNGAVSIVEVQKVINTSHGL